MIASAACVLGVLIVCLGVVGYQNNLNAEEILPVTTRGVIDQINQIPKTKIDMYDKNESNYDLGTPENPFLILEVVPYEDYAEFGYHISGCEPIKMDEAKWDGGITNLGDGNFNSAVVEYQNPAYAFPDEPEAAEVEKHTNKKDIIDWMDVTVKGYYECVEEENGTFVQDENGKFVKAANGNGNIIWHTLCDSELKHKYSDEKFVDEGSNAKVLKLGERVFTYRTSKKDDPRDEQIRRAYYYYYENKDNFLKDTLDLSQEEADNYSVIIKTITPTELNNQPKWAEYANLFVVSPKSHNPAWVNLWDNYNIYGHEVNAGTRVDGFSNVNGNDNDISWDVMKNIYTQVNKKINYGAIIMDVGVYDSPAWAKKQANVSQDVLDWNLRPVSTYTDTGYDNNMVKLAIMLLSMKSDLFQTLYMDEENPLIQFNDSTKEVEFIAQTNETAKVYWTLYCFLPTGSDYSKNEGHWYDYWTNDPSKWKDYEITGNILGGDKDNHNWINNRIFTYNGDMTLTTNYMTSEIYGGTSESKFSHFKEYMEEYKKKHPEKFKNGKVTTTSDAIRYILDLHKDSDEKLNGTLNILDIEPSYNRKNAITNKIILKDSNGKDIEGCEENKDNGYYLTKNYIHLMIPQFTGKINITHMTTAEFIGSSEDLNSKYNMIFIGMDSSAYNHDGNGNTVWNNSNMNGMVYFHVGDKMTSAEYEKEDGRSRSVKFLWSGTNNEVLDDTTLRFPGNDITRIKKNELTKFLNAGYPIVAADSLYDLTNKVDATSNIAQLVRDSKSNSGKKFFKTSQKNSITEAIKSVLPSVTFTELPEKYQGVTSSSENDTVSINDSKANYLKTDALGRSVLKFNFSITDAADVKYKYKIYIDQNQDGKFEEGRADADDEDNVGEVYYESDEFTPSEVASVIKPVKLSKLYYGLIQWKIEVYRTDNTDIHFVETGCSVAKNQTGQKRTINVLQIMPDNDTGNKGYLDLKEDKTFTKYYTALQDYTINVTTITVADFQSTYFSTKFTYDYSREISSNDNSKNPSNMSDEQKKLYNSYNMLILGFGDTFHKVNMSNENGAIDFIKYFIASGKSVLFTHDFTSMHNVNKNDFGYSANTYMRDIMGMNRYGAISNKLTSEEKNTLKSYQQKNKYDTMGKETITENNTTREVDIKNTQGFTYYAMKRLGWTDDKAFNKNQKVPYQYMIKSFMKDEYICSKNDNVKLTGFNNNNDLTTRATKTNTGQITEYPFKIDETLEIAPTHGQWYQLNMEDPEVTVWYCLADNKNAVPCAWNSAESNEDGTGATYGVSPNDAANNYYIYSKGNVFYSGVGHSTVTGDMEAKLFINTMIAAYRASYEPPMVEILNEEAELLSDHSQSADPKLTYKMNWLKEYGDSSTEKEKIWFSPIELNTVKTNLTCSIKYSDGTYVQTIYKKNGTPINGKETSKGSGVHVFENLKNMDEYYIDYDMANLENSNRRNIIFEIQNNKSKNPDGSPRKGTTTLNMGTQNLFLLD